jgi:cytoskeletal protein RodZ
MDYEARDESVTQDSFRQIGTDLGDARLAKGIQISELSQLLRISKQYLKSIEAGDFDSLPGATYAAGYLRSFAQEVGLDAVELTQRYRTLVGEVEKGPTYSFPVDTQRPQRSGAMLASIIVIFTVVGYGGWYALGKPDVLTGLIGESQPETVALPQIESTVTEPDDMAKTDVEPVDLAAVDPPAAVSADPSDTADDVVTNVVAAPTQAAAPLAAPADMVGETVEVVVPPVLETASETDLAAARTVATGSAATPVSGTPAEATQVIDTLAGSTPPAAAPDATTPAMTMATTGGATDLAAVDGAIEGLLTTPPADAATDDRMGAVPPATMDSMDTMTSSISSQIGTGVAFARQRVPDMEVTLRATGASWVEIIRNDGEEVMAKLMRAGETYMVDSRDRLYLSTGNAGGLELVFNDGTVRSVGDSGEILRDLLLDATKLRNQF